MFTPSLLIHPFLTKSRDGGDHLFRWRSNPTFNLSRRQLVRWGLRVARKYTLRVLRCSMWLLSLDAQGDGAASSATHGLCRLLLRARLECIDALGQARPCLRDKCLIWSPWRLPPTCVLGQFSGIYSYFVKSSTFDFMLILLWCFVSPLFLEGEKESST